MDVKFPSSIAYFPSSSEDILQIADVVLKEKLAFNIVFHFSISSFCFLLIQ